MRLVRLAALGIVLAAVYFAQYLFDTTTLADFFPEWLIAFLPWLGNVAQWSTDELVELAVWLTLLGLLGFGLLSPWWYGERGRAYRRLPRGREVLRAWWWVAQVLLVLALVVAGGVAWLEFLEITGTLLVGVWAISLLFYVASGFIASRVRPPVVYGEGYLENVRPWDGWPYWLGLLALFALLYTYRLVDIPIRIDALSVRVGLAAQAWVDAMVMPSLSAAPTELPLPTVLLTTASRLILRDSLLSVRVAGVMAALFALSAVWLVGSELFRRVPAYGEFGEVLEDDGRWIALMAMIVMGVSLPLLLWSRVPLILEGLGLGTFSLWALLRGLRRDRPTLLGLSALALGWSIFYGPVGLLFVFIALSLWCGVLLLESKWLTGKLIALEAGGAGVPVQRGVGWRGFAYWVGGIVIVVMPLLTHWVTVRGRFTAQWIWPDGSFERQGSALLAVRERLETTLLGLNHLADATGMIPYDEQFVYSLLAPLLAIALGALLLNIDSLVGWTLVTWLAIGVMGAALTVPVVPSWMAMVLLIPMTALAVAFVLDRLRLHLMVNAGTWTLQATVYLALGVVVTAGFFGWITYYHTAQLNGDLASSVGRALRDAQDQPVVIVSSNVALEATLNEPVVQLLASSQRDLDEIVILRDREWPPLSPGTVILLAPGDSTLQVAMRNAYPNGYFQVMRDLNSNPLLYVYEIISTASMP